VRGDKHSELDDWIFSPRINGKFQIGGGFTLRGAYTTGFKAPQTYDEDLHLGGIEGDQRVIRNAGDLKEERSNSFSGGIDFLGYLNDMPLMLAVTGYYTELKDVFTEEFVGKTGNIEEWRRVNGDRAAVQGVEVDLGIRPVSILEIRGGLTYKNSEYDKPHEDFNTKNFLRTPDVFGFFRLSMDMTSDINIFAAADYTGKADVPHEIVVEGQDDPDLVLERSDAFFQINLGFSYCLPTFNGVNNKLSFGVKNLTDAYQKDLDKGADRDPAYVYGPILPRTIYLGFETSF
ncbi:MAG: TonB-dependent receptor, partial [Calditrichales bacterium]|nr:TonB-dependent receptor [Calditrichales bacterium]